MSSKTADDYPDPLFFLKYLVLCAVVSTAIGGFLYSVTTGGVEAYRAAHGELGMPGTATVEREYDSGMGLKACEGTFAPDGGGPAVEAAIETNGPCTKGRTLDAWLVENKPIFGLDRRPTAWGEDSRAWIAHIIVLVLLGPIALPVALGFGVGAAVMLFAFLRDLAKLVFGFRRLG